MHTQHSRDQPCDHSTTTHYKTACILKLAYAFVHHAFRQLPSLVVAPTATTASAIATSTTTTQYTADIVTSTVCSSTHSTALIMGTAVL